MKEHTTLSKEKSDIEKRSRGDRGPPTTVSGSINRYYMWGWQPQGNHLVRNNKDDTTSYILMYRRLFDKT